CNAAHGLHSRSRILADRGLAGQHDRAGAVVNRVGNVGNLRAGRTRVFRHALEHLGGGYYALAAGDTDFDDALLDLAQFFKRNLDAKITAGYHDAVRLVQDLLDIAHAFHVFDLGDDLNIFLAVLLEN